MHGATIKIIMGHLNTNWVKSGKEALNCSGYVVPCDRMISKQVIWRDMAALWRTNLQHYFSTAWTNLLHPKL